MANEKDNSNYEEMMENSNLAGAVGQQAQQNAAAQYFLEEKEKSLTEIQLDVESIKSDIYHLLRQDRTVIENGKIDWKEIEDKKERILSDKGVERIMQIIHFYINTNTLLTNFSEAQIREIMHTFYTELNDFILLNYEYVFKQPTFEECREMLLEKVEYEKKMKLLSMEVLGLEADEEEIRNELIKETEKTLEKEMNKIKEKSINEKLRDYGMLVAQLEIAVFAALNRAWKGEERGSIRRHTNISELIGGRPQNQNPSGKGGFFSWGGR